MIQKNFDRTEIRRKRNVTEQNIRVICSIIEGDHRLIVSKITSRTKTSSAELKLSLLLTLITENYREDWFLDFSQANRNNSVFRYANGRGSINKPRRRLFYSKSLLAMRHGYPEGKHYEVEEEDTALVKAKARLSAGNATHVHFLRFETYFAHWLPP